MTIIPAVINQAHKPCGVAMATKVSSETWEVQILRIDDGEIHRQSFHIASSDLDREGGWNRYLIAWHQAIKALGIAAPFTNACTLWHELTEND